MPFFGKIVCQTGHTKWQMICKIWDFFLLWNVAVYTNVMLNEEVPNPFPPPPERQVFFSLFTPIGQVCPVAWESRRPPWCGHYFHWGSVSEKKSLIFYKKKKLMPNNLPQQTFSFVSESLLLGQLGIRQLNIPIIHLYQKIYYGCSCPEDC